MIARLRARLRRAEASRARPPQLAESIETATRVPDLTDSTGPAERDELRRYLADTDVFPSRDEAEGYLAHAFERYRITLELLDTLPAGARVLELGANPYFFTRLLVRRGFELTLANWFGEQQARGRGEHAVTAPRSQERHVFAYDHFNVETDAFPYDDHSFDAVLCCEILEHLPNDPTHLLVECHRVLRPSGQLVLSTPNGARAELLQRLWRGESTGEPLSGHGTYGRHNREYSTDELRSLIAGCGFRVERIFDRDLAPGPGVPAGSGVVDDRRGENLFVVATPDRPRCWHYPEWLYSSRWAMRRIVAPVMEVGFNDDLQSWGFGERLDDGSRALPTDGPAWCLLDAPIGDTRRLVVHGVAHGEIELEARVGDHLIRWQIPANRGEFVVSEPLRVDPGPCEIQLMWTTTEGVAGSIRRIAIGSDSSV